MRLAGTGVSGDGFEGVVVVSLDFDFEGVVVSLGFEAEVEVEGGACFCCFWLVDASDFCFMDSCFAKGASRQQTDDFMDGCFAGGVCFVGAGFVSLPDVAIGATKGPRGATGAMAQ